MGSFTHTLSAFQIDRPTLIEVEVGPDFFWTDDGKQRVRGVEWTAHGQLTPSLRLLGGVSYLDSTQRESGLDTYGVPQLSTNLGLDWATPMAGLDVGGRVVYTGRQWADEGNTLELPSWHRFDLNASYDTKIAGTPITFNMYVENLTDREYWAGLFSPGYLIPAPPRTFRLAATFKF